MELMKNIALLPIVIIILSASAARASECKRFNDSDFHYSICAPHDWKKNYHEEGDRHYLTFRRRRAAGTEISVTASRIGEEGKSESDGWKKWLPRGTGRGFRKIIETKELAAGDNVSVKIVVFDYYARGVRMLQRTMLSRYGDNYLVIECRASLRSFSRYTDLFNTVMSSVDYTGTMAGDAMDGPAEEKAVIRKQAKPKKQVEPKKKAEPKKRPVIEKRKEPAHDSSILKPEKEKDDSPTEKPKEEKTDAVLDNKGETTPKEVIRKDEEADIDLENIEDPEAKKVIEEELNTLQEMERKGLIEKLKDDK